ILLLTTLATAAALVLGLQSSLRRRSAAGAILRTLLAAVLGFVLVPGAIALAFALAGAWRDFLYCVFGHNLVPGLGNWEHAGWRFAILPLLLAPLSFVARELIRRDSDALRGARRAFVWLSATLYLAALISYWPLVTRQDMLPCRPLLTIFAVALL